MELLVVIIIAALAYKVLSSVVEGTRNRERAQEQERLLGCTVDDLDDLTGAQFEKWVIARLRPEGFRYEHVGGTGDFGVDVIAKWRNVKIAIQTKRSSNPVGNRAVQEVIAGANYYGCPLAAVVTQSYFTKAALKQATHSFTPFCLLIGRDKVSGDDRCLNSKPGFPSWLKEFVREYLSARKELSRKSQAELQGEVDRILEEEGVPEFKR